MHSEGYVTSDGKEVQGEEAFPGFSLFPYVEIIGGLLQNMRSQGHEITSALDYGSGKGEQYADGSIQEFWEIPELYLFDPARDTSTKPLKRSYDMIVCTDVLEHCPTDDLPWIVEELFTLANKAIFVNVACYPAKAILPDGSNAHETVKTSEWWHGLFHGIAYKYDAVYGLSCSMLTEPKDEIEQHTTH